MRQRQRVCKRGHDLDQTRRLRRNGRGGWKSGGCGACLRITDARLDRKKPVPFTRGPAGGVTLDFGPIEERLLARGVVLSKAFNGVSLKRWREHGIPVLSADAVCIRFGWHPVQVYGMEFYEGVA